MELKVENSHFGHGQGGGSFYMARPKAEEKREDAEEEAAATATPDTFGSGDSFRLPPTRASRLSLLPPVRTVYLEVSEDLDAEIQRNLRVLNLGLIRLEKDYERRMFVQIGDVVIGA